MRPNLDTLSDLRFELKKLTNPEKARVLQHFFKTGKGEYGEGDIFLGITVPQLRKLAITFRHLSFAETQKLLQSKIHEERLIALLILVHNFQKGSADDRKKIYEYYLDSTLYINNWDLVDLSADKIVGGHLLDGPDSKRRLTILSKLARSKNIWERRIAMIATYQFIKQKQFDATLEIAEILIQDIHDLIQKAVGWMLREVGNRNREVEETFLRRHYKTMPRTALRYAIEKFPEPLRKAYLKDNFSS